MKKQKVTLGKGRSKKDADLVNNFVDVNVAQSICPTINLYTIVAVSGGSGYKRVYYKLVIGKNQCLLLRK